MSTGLTDATSNLALAAGLSDTLAEACPKTPPEKRTLTIALVNARVMPDLTPSTDGTCNMYVAAPGAPITNGKLGGMAALGESVVREFL